MKRLLPLLAIVLSACAASSHERFYTLSGPQEPNPGPAAGYFAAVAPVTLPDALDRTQLVLYRGGSQVEVLEQSLWAGSLKGEIRQLLVAELSRRGIGDVGNLPAPKAPVYRVSVNVEALSVSLQQSAQWQAGWALRMSDGSKGVVCHGAGGGPAAGAIGAPVADVYRAVASDLVGQVAASLQRFAAGTVPANCARA